MGFISKRFCSFPLSELITTWRFTLIVSLQHIVQKMVWPRMVFLIIIFLVISVHQNLQIIFLAKSLTIKQTVRSILINLLLRRRLQLNLLNIIHSVWSMYLLSIFWVYWSILEIGVYVFPMWCLSVLSRAVAIRLFKIYNSLLFDHGIDLSSSIWRLSNTSLLIRKEGLDVVWCVLKWLTVGFWFLIVFIRFVV